MYVGIVHPDSETQCGKSDQEEVQSIPDVMIEAKIHL